ncbi:CocE/NonD family hydrolase [Novosphingobium nitrogenifigens]|nr:CocE/NonD family hydrolase [Novosphingobium nitrogenifigens]
MTTRDGIRLDADVYRPSGKGPWPVLLLRQGYGRRVAAAVCYAHPRWYADQGYVVVVQDVRGRGTSEGVFRTLEQEAEDGADTIAWCASLPDTTGTVGMYGFSFQGMNQLLAATLAGPELKAIAPAMIGWDLRGELVEEGGVPQLAGAIGWAAQVGADTARHQGDEAAWLDLRAAAQNPPCNSPVPLRPEPLVRHARYNHLLRWSEAEADDPLWQAIAPMAHAETLAARALPMLFIGGWHDFTLAGTLAGWRAMEATGLAWLDLGPWPHIPWGRHVGGQDYGPDAVSDVDRHQVAWFDHWLKGKPLDRSRVRLFDMGTRTWRSADRLGGSARTLFLSGTGRVSIDAATGKLLDRPGATGSEVIVHDPWRPAPSVGGRMGNPPGPVDRRAIDERGDIATFTTAPLDQPLTLSGWIGARLHLSSDSAHFDIHAVLSQVTASGAVLPFAEGHTRIAGATGVVPVDLDLKATCITLAPGESLRLSLAGAAFPAFAVNPGTGEGTDATAFSARVITLVVHHGEDHPSSLVIECLD